MYDGYNHIYFFRKQMQATFYTLISQPFCYSVNESLINYHMICRNESIKRNFRIVNVHGTVL